LICVKLTDYLLYFQPRKWPDLNLKSPGIKPRHLPGRTHPNPLPSVREALFATSTARLDNGEETPKTPLLPLSAPVTPPAHSSSQEYSVFASIMIGQGESPSYIINQ
jgi:hypothetical protein